jgi:hypothetical protein
MAFLGFVHINSLDIPCTYIHHIAIKLTRNTFLLGDSYRERNLKKLDDKSSWIAINSGMCISGRVMGPR